MNGLYTSFCMFGLQWQKFAEVLLMVISTMTLILLENLTSNFLMLLQPCTLVTFKVHSFWEDHKKVKKKITYFGVLVLCLCQISEAFRHPFWTTGSANSNWCISDEHFFMIRWHYNKKQDIFEILIGRFDIKHSI